MWAAKGRPGIRYHEGKWEKRVRVRGPAMTSQGNPVASATWGRAGRFRRPLYDSYCFSRLPATVRHLLLGRDAENALPDDCFGSLPRQYDTVVLLFLDAFGWHFYERHADALAFLKRFRVEGVATTITAQFPSTTAGHVTCIHTGVPVGQSGVYEWFYYEPRAGAVIAPLPFCYAGDHKRDTLLADGLTPADVFPPGTLYQDLEAQGVASYIFQHSDYTPSTYSDFAFRGARRVSPFKTFAEGLTNLAALLREPAGGEKRYFFLYYDAIDHIGHKHCPNSEYFDAEVEATFLLLERLLYQKAAGKCGKTLLLMTADHGQVCVNPRTTVFINEQSALPDLDRSLRLQPRDGKPIKFAGSCRDLFLHVRDEELPEVEDKLSRLLVGKAEVWRTEELIRDGLFGPQVSERLRQRLGNLALLPYEGESVYWHEGQRFDMRYYGHHGGLTPDEMDTGVYVVPL